MTYKRGKQVGPGDEKRKISPLRFIARWLPYPTLIVLFFVGTTFYTSHRSYPMEVNAGLLLFSICVIVFTLLLRSDIGKPGQ